MGNRRRAERRLICAFAALLLAGPAWAEGAAPADEPETNPTVTHELVEALDGAEDDHGLLGPHFGTHKRHGFEYTRSFRTRRGGKRIEFSVQGPLVEKKTPGLTFEVRF